MKVHVAGPLKQELQALDPALEGLFVAKFFEWKSGDEFNHYWFSNEKLGDDGFLYHAHLIPQNVPESRSVWDYFWGRPRERHRRRSDRYILYARNSLGDFLIVGIIDDPGAHLLWEKQNKHHLDSYVAAAENFVVFGVIL